MGSEGRKQNDQRFKTFLHQAVFLIGGIIVGHEGVVQFHNSADGGIEVKAFADIFGHLLDGGMDLAADIFIFTAERSHIVALRLGFGVGQHETPYAVQEAVAAFHRGVVPFQIFFRRRGEEDEETGRIGAVFINDSFGAHNIAQGFRHFRSIFQHHALGQ